MKNERRKFERFSPNKIVSNCRLLNIREGSQLPRFVVWPIKNVSAGGASVLSNEMVPFRTLAYLNIDLDILKRTVGVVGKVVWSQAREDKYAIGVEFSFWPQKLDKVAMVDYVTQNISCNDSSEE